MRPVALRAAVVLLLVAAGALLLGPLMRVDPGGVDPAPGGRAPGEYTQDLLDEWMGEHRATLWLMWGVKGLLLLGGVLFLVREILRADRERHRPSPPGPEPLVVATPTQTLWLALLFPLGVQLLLVGLFPPGATRPVGDLEFGVIVAVAAFLPPALIVVLRRWRLGGTSLPRPGSAVKAGVAFACLATLIVLPVQLGWVLALQARGVAPEVQEVVAKFARPEASYQPWLLGFFGVFVAPFTEEAVFRGLLYPALRRRMPGGPFGAAVAVSLLFALIHASLLAFVPLFVLAMVLAWTMERTNSLLACVVVHAIHNASSVLPLLVRHGQGP
jgi:membrane protease YdiL (CAAX protease family)